MISYPSIDKLLEQVDSRYSLAVLGAKRAHEIAEKDDYQLEKYKSFKTVGQAMEEIAAGKVVVDPKSVVSERVAEKMEENQRHEQAEIDDSDFN